MQNNPSNWEKPSLKDVLISAEYVLPHWIYVLLPPEE
jgi:hypothetical protein